MVFIHYSTSIYIKNIQTTFQSNNREMMQQKVYSFRDYKFQGILNHLKMPGNTLNFLKRKL